MKRKMPSARVRDVSAGERQKILARIRRIGIESGRKRADISALQQHTLAMNTFVKALAMELIKRGAAINFRQLSMAALYHDIARQRIAVNIDFRTGVAKPSSLLGSEQRTAQDYVEQIHELAAKRLLAKGPKDERKAARLLSGRKWKRYVNPKAIKHISLEQLILDLADASVEGTKFVDIDKRLVALKERMSAYSDADRALYENAFNQLKKVARERIEKKYGVSIKQIVDKLERQRLLELKRK